MVEIVSTWLQSMIENAPYLFGAVAAIYALWGKFNECISDVRQQNKDLMEYILHDRIKPPT